MWCATQVFLEAIERDKGVGLREDREGVGLRDWCLLIILPDQVACFSWIY